MCVHVLLSIVRPITVFELVAHEESEIWMRLSHNFIDEGLLQLLG